MRYLLLEAFRVCPGLPPKAAAAPALLLAGSLPMLHVGPALAGEAVSVEAFSGFLETIQSLGAAPASHDYPTAMRG